MNRRYNTMDKWSVDGRMRELVESIMGDIFDELRIEEGSYMEEKLWMPFIQAFEDRLLEALTAEIDKTVERLEIADRKSGI